MSLYGEPVPEASLAMMGRVFEDECTRRAVKRDSMEGEELARAIMHAFLSGIGEESELIAVARKLAD